MDDVVGKVELDGVEREIGVWNLFAKNHVPVAVVTGDGGGSVGADVEGPHLEFFSGDFPVVGLNQSDFIEEPIGLPVFGDMLRACAISQRHLVRCALACGAPPFVVNLSGCYVAVAEQFFDLHDVHA